MSNRHLVLVDHKLILLQMIFDEVLLPSGCDNHHLVVRVIFFPHLSNNSAIALSMIEAKCQVLYSFQPFANDSVGFDFKAEAVFQINGSVELLLCDLDLLEPELPPFHHEAYPPSSTLNSRLQISRLMNCGQSYTWDGW
jgi:hypothetical protein